MTEKDRLDKALYRIEKLEKKFNTAKVVYDDQIADHRQQIDELEKNQKAYINAWDLRTKVQQDLEEEIAELESDITDAITTDIAVLNTNCSSFAKRLSELEKKIEQIAWSKFHSNINQQINELKEQINLKCEGEWHVDKLYKRLDKLETLREKTSTC